MIAGEETNMLEVDRLVPILEGFAAIGVRRTKGYKEIAAGRLSVVRNGSRTFVRVSELRRYIDSLPGSSPQQHAA